MPEHVDFDRYIPQHVRDNHAARVEGEFGGDWQRLARQFDADGEALLARWAAAQAPAEPKTENTSDKTPRSSRERAVPPKDK